MTNTVYTLPTIKKEPSAIDEPEYMDINPDEAEAGSILMSLSQQSKRTERSTTTNTMSIQNLLEDNDERTTSHQEQVQYPKAKMNGPTFVDSTIPPVVHQYPEAAKEATQAYATGVHGYRPTSTTLPETFASMEYTAQRRSENYAWQHQQQPSHNGQYYPYHQQERYQQQPTHHHHQQQQRQQQPIKKTYSRYDPQQQRWQPMKKHPKIRRNALHAYISYMTYTDLKRTKTNAAHLQQPYGMSKQNLHSSSTPLSKPLSASTSSSSIHQHHHQHHHQRPPLTAFLKDTIDSTVPSTPIPTSSLPPIETRRSSKDWPNQHYRSSPTSPQYRYPYPTSSFSTK